jgi:hypothetical protein
LLIRRQRQMCIRDRSSGICETSMASTNLVGPNNGIAARFETVPSAFV